MDREPCKSGRAEALASKPIAEVLQTMMIARQEAADAEMIVRGKLEKYLQIKLGNGRQWVSKNFDVAEEGGNLVLSHVPVGLEADFSRAGFIIRKFPEHAHVIQVLITVSELNGGLSAKPNLVNVVEESEARSGSDVGEAVDKALAAVTGVLRSKADGDLGVKGAVNRPWWEEI